MWKLKRANEDSPYHILPTSVCRIGRQGCQIIVQDATVSRHHADLMIVVSTCSYAKETRNTSLILRDVSKFAQTAVNGVLPPSSRRDIQLHPGDKVRFGACPDIFTVQYEEYILYSDNFGESADLQSLAFRTGFPVSEDIRSSTLVIAERIDECNMMHMKAIARSLPFVSEQYLRRLADLQSGIRSLPALDEFEVKYPNRECDRQALFKGCTFLIFQKDNETVADLIGLCGGETTGMDALPDSDLAVVDFDPAENRFPKTVRDCTHLSARDVLRMIYEGSIETMRTRTKVTLGTDPLKRSLEHDSDPSQNWIESSLYTHTITGSSAGQVVPVGVKKFKKRHVGHSSNSVELEVWDGREATRRRRDSSSIPLTERNELDEWLDSYSTQ